MAIASAEQRGDGGGREAARQRQRDRALDVLARTVYGEARGERIAGKEAVAAVIMNRVRRARKRGGYWWGADVESVCTKPWQFSCWNRSDPNRDRILAAGPENSTFQSCLRVARRALEGRIEDPTDGATHYHNTRVRPHWAKGRQPSAEIGRHLFYNDVE